MNALKNLRIGTRLGGAFALMALLMLAMSLMAWRSLSQVRADMDMVLHDRYAKVKLVHDIGDELDKQARYIRNVVLMDNEEQRREELQMLAESRATLAKHYDALKPRIKAQKGLALLAQLQEERAGFLHELDDFLKSVQAGDMAAAKANLLDTLRPHQLRYMQRLEALISFQEGLMTEAGQSTIATVGQATMLTLAGTLTVLALAVVAGVLATRSVTRPMAAVVADLRTVAGGDLTVEVTVDRADELGLLQRGLADTVAALRRVVGEVRSGVDSVTTASSQIAAGNQDLSSRTEQQASSLQETASSMEELTATVRQTADTARAASNLAANASAAAGHGGEVVGQVVGTMDEISQSSRKIVDIIGVIDGIAFQTNILALNAAVEAARAGEQGRGFAVVAGEVRTLAQRSAEAAREIKALIGASVDRVEAGSRQVAEAGQAMEEIVQQVRKVSDLIGEIAGTATEQSRGIEQVNTAVAQMDQVTQQNAALVEESAAAASSLAHQAQALADAVARFRLEAGQAAATPAAPAPRKAPARAAAAATPAEPRQAAPLAPAPAPRKVAPVVAAREEDMAWETF